MPSKCIVPRDPSTQWQHWALFSRLRVFLAQTLEYLLLRASILSFTIPLTTYPQSLNNLHSTILKWTSLIHYEADWIGKKKLAFSESIMHSTDQQLHDIDTHFDLLPFSARAWKINSHLIIALTIHINLLAL